MLEGKYYLDGIDLYAAFGVIIRRAPDEFLRFPKRKPSITHDWQDSNGIDVDLSRVFFEARDITLECVIVAATKAQFWDNHQAFMAEWAKPGARRLQIVAFERSFNVFYKDCPRFERFTQLKDGKILCEFEIVINEALPEISEDAGTSNRIVDHEGNYLIA